MSKIVFLKIRVTENVLVVLIWTLFQTVGAGLEEYSRSVF